jgi:hypothetical protein
MLSQIDLSGRSGRYRPSLPPLPRFLSQSPKGLRTARRTIQFFLFHPTTDPCIHFQVALLLSLPLGTPCAGPHCQRSFLRGDKKADRMSAFYSTAPIDILSLDRPRLWRPAKLRPRTTSRQLIFSKFFEKTYATPYPISLPSAPHAPRGPAAKLFLCSY